MRVIKDKNLLKHYISKNNLNNLFDENVLSTSELWYFEKNESILKEGNKLKNYFYLVEGEIQTSYAFDNGKIMPLKIYKEFQPLGDIELIKNIPILANVDALESSYFIVFPINIIKKEYENNIKFTKHFSEILSEKIFSVIKNSSHNYIYPLQNRLASFIIQQSKNNYVEIKTFKLIAQALGTTYRHLHRVLKEFEKDNLIICEKKLIKILDKEKLNEKVKIHYIKSF